MSEAGQTADAATSIVHRTRLSSVYLQHVIIPFFSRFPHFWNTWAGVEPDARPLSRFGLAQLNRDNERQSLIGFRFH